TGSPARRVCKESVKSERRPGYGCAGSGNDLVAPRGYPDSRLLSASTGPRLERGSVVMVRALASGRGKDGEDSAEGPLLEAGRCRRGGGVAPGGAAGWPQGARGGARAARPDRRAPEARPQHRAARAEGHRARAPARRARGQAARDAADRGGEASGTAQGAGDRAGAGDALGLGFPARSGRAGAKRRRAQRPEGTRIESASGTISNRTGVVPGCSPSSTTGSPAGAVTRSSRALTISTFGCETCRPR